MKVGGGGSWLAVTHLSRLPPAPREEGRRSIKDKKTHEVIERFRTVSRVLFFNVFYRVGNFFVKK